MSNPAMVAGRPYDPRNPDVIQARELKSEYIVYYCGGNSRRWKLERVSDGVVMAEGQLEAMLSLLTIYPNSRRSTWAEDQLRGVFRTFTTKFPDIEFTKGVLKGLK